jgi:hypothetical protein
VTQALTVVSWENRDFRKKVMGEVTGAELAELEEEIAAKQTTEEKCKAWLREKRLQVTHCITLH